jgi:hypothetical protein
MTRSEHGLDTWCYDAIAQRSWPEGPALLRTAELVWIEFDSNPAVFANFVHAVQPIEGFLEHGPAVPGFSARCSSDIDAHLRTIRTPGVTTRVEANLTLIAPADRWFIQASLLVGADPGPTPVPGPGYAGLYGWPMPGATSAHLRYLARPGPQRVLLRVAINGPSIDPSFLNHVAEVELETTLDVVEGPNPLAFFCDARRWPAVELEAGGKP